MASLVLTDGIAGLTRRTGTNDLLRLIVSIRSLEDLHYATAWAATNGDAADGRSRDDSLPTMDILTPSTPSNHPNNAPIGRPPVGHRPSSRESGDRRIAMSCD